MRQYRLRLPLPVLWAARELLRHPGRQLLLFLALMAVTLTAALPLLLTQGLATSAGQTLAASPALVLRRVESGGWRPLEADSALAGARAVPGVLSAQARIWGLAGWQGRAVTVLGMDDEQSRQIVAQGWTSAAPAAGTALVGPGIDAAPGTLLTLRAAEDIVCTVTAQLPATTGLVAHDLILLPAAEARRLLGLLPDEASDLAIEVHHPAEEQALPADLAAAMPWPVRISGRAEALAALEGGLVRRGGLTFMAMTPALLALLLLVLDAARQQAGRWELGLLKALGWSTGDILRRQLLQGALLGLPALGCGLALAWGLSGGPAGALLAGWLLDWPGPPPRLPVDGSTVLAPLGLLTAAILLPWLTALVLPVLLRGTDPLRLLRGELGEQMLEEDLLPSATTATPQSDAVPAAGLAARDLSLCCGGADHVRRILERVSLTALPGEPLLITGATGAGKSSLLHILAALLRPASGVVFADGEPVSRWLAGHRDLWRRQVGIVFQQPLLFPDLTALENVMLPLVVHGGGVSTLRHRAQAALNRCRMAAASARPGRLLSGGEGQRVALARALAVTPAWLFLDEPTAHQDADGVAVVLDCLREAAARGAVVLVVSHDPRLAASPLFVHRAQLRDGCLLADPVRP